MNKFKVCPDCGFHNAPSRIECAECEADLTRVAVSDENTERLDLTPAARSGMVRICDCGAKNPAAARKCASCGEDISDIIPSEDTEQAARHFTLASVDGEYAAELAEAETVVGRERFMAEYLSGKPFVSRVHAKLTVDGGRLFITNLSSTNRTYLNNSLVTETRELRDGDEIGLGGCEINGGRQSGAAYFTVRICCT